MAKGIELPVNVLVIVAISVIVLIGLIVLLGAGLLGANPIFIKLEEANACGVLINTHSCDKDTSSISVNPKTGYNTLLDLCKGFEKVTSDAECKIKVCGCKSSQLSTTTTTNNE